MEISYVISKKNQFIIQNGQVENTLCSKKNVFQLSKVFDLKKLYHQLDELLLLSMSFLKQFLLLRTQLKQIMKFVVLGLQHEIETIVCKSLRVAQGLSRLWKQG